MKVYNFSSFSSQTDKCAELDNKAALMNKAYGIEFNLYQMRYAYNHKLAKVFALVTF